MRYYILGLASVLLAGCTRAERRVPKTGEDRNQPDEVKRVASIAGFRAPESVKYDPDQDVWFVSNIAGFGSEKDGRGYIVRISAEHLDSMSVFAISGVNGVRLDAPKGMAIQGDTLWVTDIDVLRGFNRRTGDGPLGRRLASGRGARRQIVVRTFFQDVGVLDLLRDANHRLDRLHRKAAGGRFGR